MNENFELENMRQQMNTLKKKLEKQEIVNDGLMRRSMKNTAGNISRRYYLIMALCLLMIPYSYWAFVMLNGFSIPFWIFTCVTMLVCFGGTFYNSRKVSDSNMMTCQLALPRHSPRHRLSWLVYVRVLSASSRCIFQRTLLGRMHRRHHWSRLGILSPL